jgi:hypothetical protein
MFTSHCEPEALHRPEPIGFGAPHGVQGEGRGNLVFIGIRLPGLPVPLQRDRNNTFIMPFVLFFRGIIGGLGLHYGDG